MCISVCEFWFVSEDDSRGSKKIKFYPLLPAVRNSGIKSSEERAHAAELMPQSFPSRQAVFELSIPAATSASAPVRLTPSPSAEARQLRKLRAGGVSKQQAHRRGEISL